MARKRLDNRSVRASRPVGSNSYLNKYYQYSSEAYDLEPVLLPEDDFNEPQPRVVRKRKKLTRSQRARTIRKRNQPKYVFEKQLERKVSIPAIVTSCVLFAGVLAYLVSWGMCAVSTKEIQVLNDQLKAITDTNAAVASNANESYDLERIKEIATKRLGMVKPGEHQIMYIDAPKQNYFVQYNYDESEVEQENVLGSTDLFSLFGNN